MTKKLKYMPYAQAHVELMDNGDIYLYSYTTMVCAIENGFFRCTGLYSPTTKRHISAFMAEYCRYPDGGAPGFRTAKKCCEDRIRFNIETGEIVEL